MVRVILLTTLSIPNYTRVIVTEIAGVTCVTVRVASRHIVERV